MTLSDRSKTFLAIIAIFFLIIVIAFAVLVGIAIASTQNLQGIDDFNATEAALPTQIFDRHGRLITEFFADEKRELISINEMPDHLIYAVVTREDRNFFKHKGISLTGTIRAAIGYISGNFAGGGSTITQQLATMLYFDKSDISISRKLREMWVALQLERNWSKTEILEEYLNKSWFGHNTYGVEAASEFFFQHSARELSIAESMMLALQLSSTTRYSPLRNPNQARDRQREMLNEMVALGYATQAEVDQSFEEFWQNYDYTRSGSTTAFFEREDRAPYFSEHIRYLLQNEILLGSANIYEDGYKVYTTLDLDLQDSARNYLQAGIASADRIYENNVSARAAIASDTFSPIVQLLGYGFDIDQFQITESKESLRARNQFTEEILPFLDLLTLMSEENNATGLRTVISEGYSIVEDSAKQNTVEGALISIDNETGHVLAMIGGNQFEQNNQLNRALSARVQPGSSFKPLYYAAAIENEIITPATMIYDSPVVFQNDDGTPYTPTNYRGEWNGPVLVRDALARSMNVPSLRILNRLGFTDAIDITSQLLGIPEREQVNRGLVRKYPIGLGVIAVSPIMMAQAFATFPNGGERVTPVFIRYIEDRRGRIIAEPERDIREEQARNPEYIISPQTSYIMTNILQGTVTDGTLRYPTSVVNGFDGMPIAGKTGTTQNWSALWTVGFSPYYTTAVWIGFDEGSNSLGVNQTGALTAGPIWARFMKDAHSELEPREFTRPRNGIVELEVTQANGLLPPAGYSGETYTELFLRGTEPTNFDESEEYQNEVANLGRLRIESSLLSGGISLSSIRRVNSTSRETSTSVIDSANDFAIDLNLNLSPDIANAVLRASETFTNNNVVDSFSDVQGNPFIDDDNDESASEFNNVQGNPILDDEFVPIPASLPRNLPVRNQPVASPQNEETQAPIVEEGNPLLDDYTAESTSLIPPEGSPISEEGNPYLD